MLSRVAESLYWISAYIERAENVARIINVNYNLTMDSPIEVENQWQPIVVTTGDDADFIKRYEIFNRQNVIEFLTYDLENPNSIYSCIKKSRENARTIREVISSEIWEEINEVYHYITAFNASFAKLEKVQDLYHRIKKMSSSFTGLVEKTMIHNEAYHFIKLGELMERADKISRIIDVKYLILLPRIEYVNTPFDDIQWGALLKSAGAFDLYKQKYRHINYRNIIEFLILDGQFSRSIKYCILNAESTLENIAGETSDNFINKAKQDLTRLKMELESISADEIKKIGLHEYLDELQLSLVRVGNNIFKNLS